MPITLQFVADDAVIDPVIRWYSHAWCTHVDSVWIDKDGQEKLIGARIQDGVKIRAINYANFVHVERVVLPASDEQLIDYYQFLMDQVGKPYDETAILGCAFDREWRADGHWMCSELAAAGLEKVDFFGHRLSSPSNRITPGDLWLTLSAVLPLPEVHDVR